MSVRRRIPPPRLALSVEEACESLGVGQDFWRDHVAGDLPVVRRGRRKLVPVRALEKWLEQNAERLPPELLGENNDERRDR